jgi:hypothetical protein
MKARAPLDGAGGRATSNTDLQIACRLIDRAGVVPVLAPFMDAEVGRHRTICVRGLLVACQLNALARHHRAHLVEVARIINALTDDQRDVLGIVKHDPAQTYDRVDRLFNKLCDVLDAGHVVEGVKLDAKWLANRLAAAAVSKEFRTSSSVAVDGTDVETWGALHGDAVTPSNLTVRLPIPSSWTTVRFPNPRGRPARRRCWVSAGTGVTSTPSTRTPGPGIVRRHRAPLVAWAFEVYATGDYSLLGLLRELTAKGLNNRASGEKPERPMHLSKLYEMLTNSYYLGIVTYRGV